MFNKSREMVLLMTNETIFNIVKPMTHKTRERVKLITVLHYLTNLHHVINKTA